MLERQGLILTGWTSLAQLPVSPSWTTTTDNRILGCPILDLGTRRFLGFASSAKMSRQPLFARSALEVYETEDASLLFSLYRPWLFSWTWDVFDAEEHCVGILYRGTLFDGAANRLGFLHLAGAADRGRFVDLNGRELASFEVREEELQLSFSPPVEGQPFVRMNLLAAVLAFADRLLLRSRRVAAVHPATGAQPC